MKHLLAFILLICSVSVACGQGKDICTHLQETGRVSIQQDERLSALVGTQPKVYTAGGTKLESQTSVNGFRIRIHSGNQQSVSKNRCYSIEARIREQQPDLPTYVTFKTPNWRISVGDFRTSEEASAMLAQLRREFPEFSKEMFIVKEKINL